jgi:hypothetical protein
VKNNAFVGATIAVALAQLRKSCNEGRIIVLICDNNFMMLTKKKDNNYMKMHLVSSRKKGSSLEFLSYNWKPDDINSVEKYWGLTLSKE